MKALLALASLRNTDSSRTSVASVTSYDKELDEGGKGWFLSGVL